MLQQFAQVEEIERAMREEHQKDLDALARLKRFVPMNGTSTGVATANASLSIAPITDVASKRTPPATPSAEKSHRAHVAEIMAADAAINWSAQAMVARLRKLGVKLEAKNPTPGIQGIMVHWVKQGKAMLVHKGTGRTPNLYCWKAGATLEGVGGNM